MIARAREKRGPRRGARVPPKRPSRLGAVRMGSGLPGCGAIQAGGRDHRQPGIRGVHHSEQPETLRAASTWWERREEASTGGVPARPRAASPTHRLAAVARTAPCSCSVHARTSCRTGPCCTAFRRGKRSTRDARASARAAGDAWTARHRDDQYVITMSTCENTPSDQRRCGSSVAYASLLGYDNSERTGGSGAARRARGGGAGVHRALAAAHAASSASSVQCRVPSFLRRASIRLRRRRTRAVRRCDARRARRTRAATARARGALGVRGVREGVATPSGAAR